MKVRERCAWQALCAHSSRSRRGPLHRGMVPAATSGVFAARGPSHYQNLSFALNRHRDHGVLPRRSSDP